MLVEEGVSKDSPRSMTAIVKGGTFIRRWLVVDVLAVLAVLSFV